jgi:Tol biopolymer transport system component
MIIPPLMKRITIFVYILAVFSACNTTPRSTPSILPDLTPIFNQPNPTNLSGPTSPITPTEKNTHPNVDLTAIPVQAIALDSSIHWIPEDGGIPVTSYSPNGAWTAKTIFSGARLLLQVARTDGSLTWLVIDKKGPLSLDYPFPSQFRWSTDGRYLYYYGSTSRQYLHRGDETCDIGGVNVDPYRLDLESGAITSLDPQGNLEELSISPDARAFAYFDPDRNINVLTLRDLETGEEKQLTFDVPTGEDWTVSEMLWAPDESAMAFTVMADPCNPTGVYPISLIVVDLKTVIARTLIEEDPDLNWQFEWVDSQILLLHDKEGTPRRIHAKGGLAISEEQMPSLSPDEGDDLGWLSFIANEEGNPAVYAIRANGSDRTQLSGNLLNLFSDVDHPRIEDWSSNGAWIAFTGLPRNGNDRDIYIARMDTLERKNLTDSPATDGTPDWSPDGAEIAYFSQLPGWDSKPDLYLIRVSEGEQGTPSKLTDTLTFDSEPAWSPDGSRIAFVRSRRNHDGTDLCLLNLKDGSIEQLTDNPGGKAYLDWSPDGKQIAFASDLDGLSRIYVMDSNGSNLAKVTRDIPGNPVVLNYSPIWSPNGKYIAYISTRNNRTGIYIARVDGTGEWLVMESPVWLNSLYWGVPTGLPEP